MEEKSLAWELLQDTKKANKRMFIIWIITFLALIGVTGYTIYLLNDIGTIETSQKIEDVETIRERINNVTLDEVIELNKKISPSVIYLLKGDSK